MLLLAVRGELAISFIQRLGAVVCSSVIVVSEFDLSLRHSIDHLMAALLIVLVIGLDFAGQIG